VDGTDGPPADFAAWRQTLRARFQRQTGTCIDLPGAIGVQHHGLGRDPTVEQLLADFPSVNVRASRIEALRTRLDRWRQD
jgi:hypothetical protein